MRLLVFVAAFALVSCASGGAQSGGDPYLWLEDVHGARALEWVKAENVKSTARLDGDKRYATYRSEALAILTAKDRLAYPNFRADGVDSLWQDAEHPHGLWRHASIASYRAGKARWDTTLDLDALSTERIPVGSAPGALQPLDSGAGGRPTARIRRRFHVEGTSCRTR